LRGELLNRLRDSAGWERSSYRRHHPVWPV
jgi:hypothetical protein